MDTQSEAPQKSTVIGLIPYHQRSFAATRSQFGSVQRFLLDNGFAQHGQSSGVAQHSWYDTPTLWYYHAEGCLKTTHSDSAPPLLSLCPLDDSGVLSSITTLNQALDSSPRDISLLTGIPAGIVHHYLLECHAPLDLELLASLQVRWEVIELSHSVTGKVQLFFEQENNKRSKGLLWLRFKPGSLEHSKQLHERLSRRCGLSAVRGVERERLQRVLKSRIVIKLSKKNTPAKGARLSLAGTIETIVGKQLAQLRQTVGGTRLGISDEPLHDFRIACQQIRVALSLFAPPLCRTGELQSTIGALRTVLGAVRDCDVFLSREGAATLEPALLRGVLEQRATARQELLIALRAQLIEPLLESIEQLSRDCVPNMREGFVVSRTFGSRLLAAERFGVRRSVERCRALSHAQTLHSVRKSIKRARYATEWLGGKGSVRELKRYKALQKELGVFHDAIVAIERLEELGRLGGIDAKVVEQRVGPLQQSSREAQQRFWALWQKWFEP